MNSAPVKLRVARAWHGEYTLSLDVSFPVLAVIERQQRRSLTVPQEKKYASDAWTTLDTVRISLRCGGARLPVGMPMMQIEMPGPAVFTISVIIPFRCGDVAAALLAGYS